MGRVSPLALRLRHHLSFPSSLKHPPLSSLSSHILQPFLHSPPMVRASANGDLYLNTTVLVTRGDEKAGWHPSYAASLNLPPDMRGTEGNIERRVRSMRGGWYPERARRLGINLSSPTSATWRRPRQPHAYYGRVAKFVETTPLVRRQTTGTPLEAIGVFHRDRPDGMRGINWLPCGESSDPRERLGGLDAEVESRWAEIRDGKVVDMASEAEASEAETAGGTKEKKARGPAFPLPVDQFEGVESWSYTRPIPSPKQRAEKTKDVEVKEKERVVKRVSKLHSGLFDPSNHRAHDLLSQSSLSTIPVTPPLPPIIPQRLNILRNPILSAPIAAQYVAYQLALGKQNAENVFGDLVKGLSGREEEDGEGEKRKKGGKGGMRRARR